MLLLIFSGVGLFLIRAVFMFWGQYKSKSFNIKSKRSDLPFVSIIVPARNEESNIERCLIALKCSDYPQDKFEIIAVNDRSDDNTALILENLRKDIPNLVPIHVTEQSANSNLKGKPGALQAGIEVAKGEYFLMTDADCSVDKSWISTIVNTFGTNDFNLIPSFTLIEGNRFFDKIQALEWIYLHTMASAGVALKTPLGCYGNNLSVKREIYEKLGGYENIEFSVTEDLALLKAVHSNYGKVHYLCDKNGTVTTYPEKTLMDYIKQHRRWALGGLALGKIAALFVITSIGIWFSILLSFIIGQPLLGIGIFAFRVLADASMIINSINRLRLKSTLYLWLIPSIVFFLLMELILPILMIDKKITWKGQTFGK